MTAKKRWWERWGQEGPTEPASSTASLDGSDGLVQTETADAASGSGTWEDFFTFSAPSAPASPSSPQAGSPGTAGVSVAVASGATAAEAAYGLTGSGIKIGIISDSFDASGQAANAEAVGALPNGAAVEVLDDSRTGHDEGLAMAEIVHDVAPGAEIAFADAGGSVTKLAAAIASLQAAGCNIICDDVSYGNEPFYQMGDAAETAISTFTAAGGTYFTAASNAGAHSSYESRWSGVTAVLPGVGAVRAMNFGTAAAPQTTETLTLKAGRETKIDLQWAQPWASLDTRGSAYSLAVALYDPSGNLVDTISNATVGGDAFEYDAFTPTVSGNYKVAVYLTGGKDPGGQFKIVANDDSEDAAVFADSSGSGSIFGHEMDPDAITVGAVDARSTPAYGHAPVSERFSSAGPGEELFDTSGAALVVPKPLHAVDISGPDGQATTLPEADLNPFYGTSAATPAVAAVGALMLDANPSLDSGEIKALLQGSALAFGSAAQAGAGLVQAQGAVALAKESNTAIRDDLFETGQSALVWKAGGGSAELSEVSDDEVTDTTAIRTPVGAGWHAVASGDFSGVAGQSGLLWQNVDGRLAISRVTNGRVTAQTVLATDPGRAWSVVGTGDFNGDGQSDILLQNRWGAVEINLMNGGRVASQQQLQGPGPGWSAVAVGDADADGKSDIVWQNTSGALALWMMDGVSVASELTLASNPGSDWHVAGLGDFAGDGSAEILLQNAATDALQIWGVDGSGITSKTAVAGAPGAGWQVAGIGDFDTSGHAGILFDDAATGSTLLAEIRHGQIVSTAGVAAPGAGWTAIVS